MPAFVTPYVHIQSGLTAGDLGVLRASCKRYLLEEEIPCYVLVNNLELPTYRKIKASLEKCVGEPLYYLNDFYMYTDCTFKTSWHVDTELFAFDRAINAWILLSPEAVEDPLGFISGINDSPESTFHSVRIDKDQCVFGDYFTGRTAIRSSKSVEEEQIHTPRIKLGDILVLNPRRFHKTNTSVPKHAFALKFVMKGNNGFLSTAQVDPYLWPEVGIFDKLVKRAQSWEDVIDGIRRSLLSETGRKELTAGFYPDKFELYRRMAGFL